MALAKAASGMVGEAAMGRVSMKVDEARQAELCNRAWDLSPSAPAPLKLCRSAAKASSYRMAEVFTLRKWKHLKDNSGSELAHLTQPQSVGVIVKCVQKALQEQALGTITWPVMMAMTMASTQE
jgi:hypothetical protein